MIRRPYSHLEESYIEVCVKSNIPIKEIATKINRSVGSVDNKIRRLNLIYPCKVQDAEIREKIKLHNMKRKEALKAQESKKIFDEEYYFKTANVYLGDRWKEALKYTKARIEEFNGDKTFMLDGKPVTIFQIMKIYHASLI